MGVSGTGATPLGHRFVKNNDCFYTWILMLAFGKRPNLRFRNQEMPMSVICYLKSQNL
ncbi:hypothetical protein [Flavobacterium sp.]|uniref:hypothetical protein n=1 Tax=Flavobacterium sp. TaxID=239 RepID=UPI003D0A27FC